MWSLLTWDWTHQSDSQGLVFLSIFHRYISLHLCFCFFFLSNFFTFTPLHRLVTSFVVVYCKDEEKGNLI